MKLVRSMKPLLGAAIFFLLTVLFVKTQTVDPETHNAIVTNLDELKRLDAVLDQEILEARFSQLSHYDPLVASLAELRAGHHRLKAGPYAIYRRGQADIDRRVEAYEQMLGRKELLLEQFKSANALLENSLRYFPAAIAQAREDHIGSSHAAVLSGLLLDTLIYNLSASAELRPKILVAIDSLEAVRRRSPRAAAAVDNVIAHARVIMRTKDEVDGLVGELISLPSSQRADEIYRAYNAYYERQVHRGYVYRFYLYVVSVVLLAYVAHIVLKLHRDIAERKRVEAALRASEEQYRALVEGSIQGIAIHRELIVLFANRAWAAMFGYGTPEEVVGLDLRTTLATHEVARVEAYKDARLRGEAAPPRYEFEAVRRDGIAMRVEVVASVVSWRGEQAILGTYFDVTERRQAEAALRNSEEQIRQLQKLEAVGRLAGGIAHDFNNLLTIIRGRAHILHGLVEGSERQRKQVEVIAKTSQRAAVLTAQLLAFSRKQILQPKVLDLNALVGNMEDMLQRLIGEDVDLLFVSGAKLGRVKADPSQLEQVVMNLAVNARDAMPRGGRLTLETGDIELDEQYARQHVGVQPGRYVMLAVSDSGIGMDAATRARIFEPFFTTKPAGKGTGLGLATVYGIVKQSGGNIWVYSEPGQGTTFKIYLPQVEAAVDELEPSEPSAAPQRGGEHILLVEDEDELGDLVREVLEGHGYIVLQARHPADAVTMAERHPGPIHLLVTDVVMPEMSGPQLAASLASSRPAMRVLYMSGYTDDAIVHHGVLDPGTPFVQKPFTPEVLARKVREVLDTEPPEASAQRRGGRRRPPVAP
jgi:PAS domain S-box-containing protein